jgi:hypothetical protein
VKVSLSILTQNGLGLDFGDFFFKTRLVALSVEPSRKQNMQVIDFPPKGLKSTKIIFPERLFSIKARILVQPKLVYFVASRLTAFSVIDT